MAKSLEKHKRAPRGRYFYSAKQLAEYRWMESLMFARSKREHKPVGSYRGIACGCGCGPFVIQIPSINNNEPRLNKTPKRPTKQPRKTTNTMFSGNVIE